MKATATRPKEGEGRAPSLRRVKPSRWGEQRRLEFIDFRLLWDGRINRGELVDFFEISIQQASLDLAEYMAAAPGNLVYDRQSKVYRASKTFGPVFVEPDSKALLNQLLALNNESPSSSLSFIGWRPPFEIVQLPVRAIRPEILIRVLWAIRDSEELDVDYQSMRQPESSRRWIAPHAIAFDGARWHVRAWNRDQSDFRDFVLGRIQDVHGSRPTDANFSQDMGWHTVSTVVLRPRASLTRQQRRAIEAEFEMRNGQLRVSLRQALVFYFVRQLQLHRSSELPAIEQPLEWVNEDEFSELLKAARK